MKGLTQRQLEILDFIQNYIKKYRFSPSYREIMHHFSFSSAGSVYKYIQTLKRKGVLTAEKNCSRSLSLTETMSPPSPSSELAIPFIGNLSIGYPLEMFVQSQNLSMPAFLVPSPENTYILRMQGDDLNEELIADGDLLLVEARQDAQAGEMVIGLINQHDTVVKKYYPEGQYIRLEGNAQQPLILRSEHLAIQGILIGVIRAY